MKIIEHFKKLEPNETRVIEAADCGGDKVPLIKIDCNDHGLYSATPKDDTKWYFGGVITRAEVAAQCERWGLSKYEWEIYKTREELKEEVKSLQAQIEKLKRELAETPCADKKINWRI